MGSYKKTFAQDMVNSQYYSAPIAYNPAGGAFSYAPKFNLSYRDQMPFYNRAFINIGLNYDQYFDILHGGIGVNVQNDRYMKGIYNTFRVDLNYHLRIFLQKNLTLNIGFGAGLYDRKLNWNKLTFDDMIHLPLGFEDSNGNPFTTTQTRPDQENYLRPDFSTGAFLFSTKAFAGISVRHLSQPSDYFYDQNTALNRNYLLQAGYEFYLQKKIKITPNLIASYQDTRFQGNLGVNIFFKPVWAGAYYRRSINASQSMIFVLGFQKEMFKIGYSYDLGISRFASMKYGAHELNLTIQLEESEQGKRQRRMSKNISCPSFLK